MEKKVMISRAVWTVFLAHSVGWAGPAHDDPRELFQPAGPEPVPIAGSARFSSDSKSCVVSDMRFNGTHLEMTLVDGMRKRISQTGRVSALPSRGGQASSPNGRFQADTHYNTVTLTDSRGFGNPSVLTFEKGLEIRDVVFTGDSEFLVAGDSTFELREAPNGNRVRQYNIPDNPYILRALNHRNVVVAIGMGRVQVFRKDQADPVVNLDIPPVPHTAVLSSDGSRLAFTSQGGEVFVFDTRTGEQFGGRPFDANRDWDHKAPRGILSDATTALAFSADGETMALASDGTVELREVRTGELMDRFQTRHSVGAMAFHPDGNHLIVASDAGLGNCEVSGFNIQLPQMGDVAFPTLWTALAGTARQARAVSDRFGAEPRLLPQLAAAVVRGGGEPPETRPLQGGVRQRFGQFLGEVVRAGQGEIRLLRANGGAAAEIEALEARLQEAQRLNGLLRVGESIPVSDAVSSALAALDDGAYRSRELATQFLKHVGSAFRATHDRASATWYSGVIAAVDRSGYALEGQRRLEMISRHISELGTMGRAPTGEREIRNLRAIQIINRHGGEQRQRLLRDIVNAYPAGSLEREDAQRFLAPITGPKQDLER